MSKEYPIVAIVGRTNVGKSTLFNRILGRRVAVVDDYHGVTRDRNYAFVKRYDKPFTLVDTGGLVGEQENALSQSIRDQAELAIAEADVVIALFDGLEGIHPHDSDVVDLLRRSTKPVLWVINKCESDQSSLAASDFFALGIPDTLAVSAAHGVGISELIEAVMQHLNSTHKEELSNADAIKVAIIGKPNVGKSSLVNRLLGEERLVVSEKSGTTRDTIDISLTRDGQRYLIVDTAGLRKKAKVLDETPERYGNLRSLKALVRCDVAVVVLDATDGAPTEQDTKIAGLAHERGRAVVLVVNKWDAVEKDHKTVKSYETAIRESLKFMPYAPIVFVSAISGRRCPKILETVKHVHERSLIRIPTNQVNKVLERAFSLKPPPIYRGHSLKLFYASQVDTAPPTFALVLNYPQRMRFSYERYLKNTIRKEYGFEGSDIKFILRKRGEDETHA